MSDDYPDGLAEQAEDLWARGLMSDAEFCGDIDYPNPSDIDICPAGGPHTPVDNFTEADDSGRRISPGWHCGECGASLPSPERREP